MWECAHVANYMDRVGGSARGDREQDRQYHGRGNRCGHLLGIVGAVIGGWLFDLFDGSRPTGFNLQNVYSAGTAAIGAVIALVLYHAFFRRRML